MRGILTTLLVLLAVMPAALAAPTLSEDVRVSPAIVDAGDAFTVSYELVDPDVLGEVATDISMNGVLLHQTIRTVRDTRYEYRERFVLPDDLSGEQTMTIRIFTNDNRPITVERDVFIQSVRDVRVLPATTSSSSRYAQQIGDGSIGIIVDPEVPNVLQGEWLYWPVTLINQDEEAAVVRLGVEGVRDWGTYRIDPTPVVEVPAGGEEQAYLFIAVDEDAWAGLRYFTITAEHDGMMERQDVAAAVLKPAQREGLPGWGILLIVIGLALLLVLAAIIVYAFRERTGGEDDDLVTYY